MKKTISFGICAVAALALTMGGCSRNSEGAGECKDKASCSDSSKCCKDGQKSDGKCCKDKAGSGSMGN